MHIHREEARIAGHAVHRPLIIPGVWDWRHERLRGRAAPRAGAALAGSSSFVPGMGYTFLDHGVPPSFPWSGLRGIVAIPPGPFLYPTPILYSVVLYLSTYYGTIFCTSSGKVRSMEVDVERLKELRRERVLSLRELEERSGVSYNTIWRIEDGRQGAHPRTIRKLAEALGVEPSELVKEGGRG